MNTNTCYHCGGECGNHPIIFDDKNFCCTGCKTVYEIFNENELTSYYDIQNNPGAIPKEIAGKYDYLDEENIIEKLTEFRDEGTEIVTLYIPHIHCSSCIWILENLKKLNPNISSSQVTFGKKLVRVTYNSNKTSLKNIVLLLSKIGYEPYISLDDYKEKKNTVSRALIYKLGVASFGFGNIMFLSFPEYFEINEFWLEQYKHVFRWLMFVMSLPLVFYSAQDYFSSAIKGIRSKILNIDIPIALGIIVLFLRSSIEIIFDLGSGFLDSLAGLIFFLLLGKFFQQKTYDFLSFERDYKSYFPIAITKITNNKESSIQVYDIKKGDRLIIRNEELIPVDCILMEGVGNIDYSFVTGESERVKKISGDKLFAGGKQTSGVLEVEALKSVEQSYLTQLWSNDVFSKSKEESFTNITNSISRFFTITILCIAFIATTYWLFNDYNKAINVFTAVLIIACPCAIALSAPFTFGNLLRIFGKHKFYIKNATVIEQLAKIDSIIFDKTGTITSGKSIDAKFQGKSMSSLDNDILKSSLRGSNHPLSRSLYKLLGENNIVTLDNYTEHIGKGIESKHNDTTFKIGSAKFVGKNSETSTLKTVVHISKNNEYIGKYTFFNNYRKGVAKLFNQLKNNFDLTILSGDNSGEYENLKKLLPAKTKLIFNQKPNDKLEFIKFHQSEGSKILMIGDGLNDAGALAQSNVGIAISEDVNVFSPACDAILDASKFTKLYQYIKVSKKAINIIKWSFVLSFFYNVIGLYFAVTGQLAPVVAAILMPLSSISIVVFTTISTNILGRKLK